MTQTLATQTLATQTLAHHKTVTKGAAAEQPGAPTTRRRGDERHTNPLRRVQSA